MTSVLCLKIPRKRSWRIRKKCNCLQFFVWRFPFSGNSNSRYRAGFFVFSSLFEDSSTTPPYACTPTTLWLGFSSLFEDSVVNGFATNEHLKSVCCFSSLFEDSYRTNRTRGNRRGESFSSLFEDSLKWFWLRSIYYHVLSSVLCLKIPFVRVSS